MDNDIIKNFYKKKTKNSGLNNNIKYFSTNGKGFKLFSIQLRFLFVATQTRKCSGTYNDVEYLYSP